MAIRNESSGSATSVATDAGPGTIYANLMSRASVGSSTVPVVRRTKGWRRTLVSYPVIVPPSRPGGKPRSRIMRQRVFSQEYLDSVLARGQKKKYNEMSGYSLTYSLRNDRLCTFAFPGDAPRTCTGENAGFANYQFVPNNTWTSNHDIALMGKLREKLAGSDFNLGVSLGEGREALKTITSAANRLYKAYYAAKRGKYRHAADVLTRGTDRESFHTRQSVASNWLELQYGWLPLIKDVQGAAEYLAEYMNGRKQVVKVRLTVPSPVIADSAAMSCSGVHYVRKQIVAHLTEVDEVALLGLTDPLSVAWELMPYSFVIDWFIPVGNFLSARALSSALKGKFAVSTKTHTDIRGFVNSNPSVCVVEGMESYRYVSTVFNRDILTSLSIPLPSFKPLEKVLSWKRAANAVGLLSQLHDKHRAPVRSF